MHEVPSSDPNTEASDINFSELAEVRNLAERAKDQVAYAGFLLAQKNYTDCFHQVYLKKSLIHMLPRLIAPTLPSYF